MSVLVRFAHRIRVGRFRQAQHFPIGFIDPIIDEPNAVLRLCREVLLVRSRDGFRSHIARTELVNIQEQLASRVARLCFAR